VHLNAVSTDIWQVTTEIRQPGGVRLPLNMTVVRLSAGLVVVSPIPVDDLTARKIDALGTVSELIAPSLLHHLHIDAARTRWPWARVLAPPGLAVKRPDLRVDGELPGAAPQAWRGTLDLLVVGGAPRLAETVLFHRATGTLICADLVFHVTRPANWRTRFVLWLMGVGGGRVAQSRAWRLLTTDRNRVCADFEHILGWPVRCIAFGHGEPYGGADARERLARAFVFPLHTLSTGRAT